MQLRINHLQVMRLILSIILVSTLSCTSREIVVERWPNGEVKKVWIQDREIIYETNFFPSKNKASEGILIDDKKEKQWKYFYENGNLEKKIFFKNDQAFLEAIFFYENGNIKQEGSFGAFGTKNGEWSSYFESGVLKSQGFYNQDIKTGIWSYFTEESRLILEETYDMEGNLEYLSRYNDGGLLVYHQKFFKQNGVQYEIITSDESPALNLFKSYYENTQIKKEGFISKGIEVGRWKFWHQNGQLMAQGEFMEDTKKKILLKTKNKEWISRIPEYQEIKGTPFGLWEYWNYTGIKIGEVVFQVQMDSLITNIIYRNEEF